MENQKTTTAEVVKEVPGHTVISFTRPTPVWATWVFRVVFILTTGASLWVAATSLIPANQKTEIMVGLKVLDFIVWGIGRGLGVKKEDFENGAG